MPRIRDWDQMIDDDDEDYPSQPVNRKNRNRRDADEWGDAARERRKPNKKRPDRNVEDFGQ